MKQRRACATDQSPNAPRHGSSPKEPPLVSPRRGRPSPGGRPSESFPAIARCLPIARWPAADRAAWEAACRPARLLALPGAAAHLASHSQAKRATEWGRFLSYLMVAGSYLPQETPGQRLTAERLGGYIRSLRARLRDSTARQQIRDLSYTIAAMAPGQDWSWVRRHPALPTEAEARAARQPFAPPDPVQLLRGALRQCDHAELLPPSPEASVRYRDGLLIAIGVVTGLRRKNLAEIAIGQHLLLEPEQVRLVFDTTIKNGEIFDTTVPEFLLPYLRRYLDHHRPLLLQGRSDCAALWINLDGRPLAYEALYSLFRKHGIRFLGRRVTPHALRHALATALLREDPNNVKLAASALAHRGIGTVNQFYDYTDGGMAGDQWQRAIRRRRRDRSPSS